jgi:hypothetical protein
MEVFMVVIVWCNSVAGVSRIRATKQTILYADIRALVSDISFVHRRPVALSRLGGCLKVLNLCLQVSQRKFASGPSTA